MNHAVRRKILRSLDFARLLSKAHLGLFGGLSALDELSDMSLDGIAARGQEPEDTGKKGPEPYRKKEKDFRY